MNAETVSNKLTGEADADQFNDASRGMVESSPEKAHEYANQALALSQKLDYRKGIAASHYNIGLCYMETGKFEEALREFSACLEYRKELQDVSGIRDAFKNMGTACLYQGAYVAALSHYREAIELSKQLKDEKTTADLYTNSGIIYHFQGNHTQALKSHLTALDIYQHLNERERMASSYTNIGIIYFEQKNFDEALMMYEKALAERLEKHDERSLCDLYNNMGNVYRELKQYDQALKNHSMALVIRQKRNDTSGIAYSYNNLGVLYADLGDGALSREYHEKSLELWKELDDKRGMAKSYINLGEIYLQNDAADQAELYLREAMVLAYDTGEKNALRDAYRLLSELYAHQQDYKSAYEYYVQYSATEKEITSAEISRQLTQMALRSQMEQKEKETELEREKNLELKKAYDSLDEEKRRSDSLLHNILPEEIALEIKQTGHSEPRHYDQVTVLFADIRNFTAISEKLSPKELLESIDQCFRQFDLIVEARGVEKIKVIGDAYMCAGGVPVANFSNPVDVVWAALEMQSFLREFAEMQRQKGLPELHFRMGVHTGPVVAGIVGLKKFAYDIWGDTVNLAARMESSGEEGKVNVSGVTYALIKHQFRCTYRGKVEAKNKGLVDMYFVEEALLVR